MKDGLGQGTNGRSGKESDLKWRRFAVAGALSMLVHLVLVLSSRPQYRLVADFAVEMEVLDGLPGSPDQGPETTVDQADDPAGPEPEPTPSPAVTPPASVAAAGTEPMPALLREDDAADAGVADGGPDQLLAAGALPGDAGPGDGGGICLHDLFQFGEARPSWLLWLSLASFRETVYQKPLAATLGSFGMYREMAGVAGMDPGSEVEGLLVTASDPFDWSTFRVVATYDSGEERLKSRLAARRRDEPGFSLRRVLEGYVAEIPGEYRWRMVGSGRVLVVESAPRAPVTAGPFAAAPAVPEMPQLLRPPENPYIERDTSADADAGPAPRESAADAGVETPPMLPPAREPAGRWPDQVTCLARPERGPIFASSVGLAELGRSHLGPDAAGHWPVAMLTTDDARVLGLQFPRSSGLSFRWALVKGFFLDPVRIEGTVFIEADRQRLEGIARSWREMARQAGGEPLLAMVGLRGVFDRLTVGVAEDRIEFTLLLSEGQVLAALMFIQLQGEAIERRIERRRDRPNERPPPPRTIPPISLATLPDNCV